MKDMYEIRQKNETSRTSIEANGVVGKKVLDRHGRKIGNVGAIHIHPRRLSVEGIRVNKGIGHKDEFIGKNYIHTLSTEGALLKITPVKELVGAKVYDSGGRKIGEVKKVKREYKGNNLTSISVDRGITKKDMIFTRREIKDIGDRVITLKHAIRER